MRPSPVIIPWASTCGVSDCVVHDNHDLTPPFGAARIVVPHGSEDRASQLLEVGATQVLLGEAALRDGACVSRLVARHGASRVGVFVPVRRAAVSWSLDPHSNADFTCLVTSTPVPRWDALLSNGETTGTDAIRWAEQMIAAGAAAAFFSTDLISEDLLLVAECVERLGEHAWFATREACPDVESWAQLAGASRFVVPVTTSVKGAAA